MRLIRLHQEQAVTLDVMRLIGRLDAEAGGMKAREKFVNGQRVQLSALGHARVSSRSPAGVIVGFGRRPDTVRVLPDGLKTTSAYHMDFWEAEAGPSAQEPTP